MVMDKGWFTEACVETGSAFSLKLKNKLHEERTPFQIIEVYETERFGKLMTLDGLVMLTDRDNFIYHEMITHPALFTHPAPRQVLVIGGGDCGSVREVLAHAEVERVELVEIDERVTRVAEQYFPELCSANADARARFHFADGIQWVAQARSARYDVIIVDSTDPVGPAAGLFAESFYRDCQRALGADGVLVVQSESPLFHLTLMKRVRDAMRAAGFVELATLGFPQCSYPSGWWTATLASKRVAPSAFRVRAAGARPLTRYYSPAVHAAALVMPPFMEQALLDP